MACARAPSLCFSSFDALGGSQRVKSASVQSRAPGGWRGRQTAVVMLIVRGTRSSGLVGSLRWDGKTKGAGPRRRAAPRRDNAGVGARAVGGGQDGEDEQVMSEEVLNRLQEAEREAAELRKQLADLKSDGAEGAASDAGTSGNGKGRLPNRPEVKVDGVSTRENFLYPQSDVWLGETNAEFAQFMAKDGVSESSYQTGVSPEDQGLVTRRLILGIAGTVAVGLLGLIPTEKLDLTSPSQPLFALLVPILEAKDEFPSIEDKVTYAEWSVVQSKVKSILGKPTQLKNTMLQVAKLESDAKRADQMRAYARETADYLSQVDYDQYFDTLIKPSGKQEIEFSQFSLDSLAASKVREIIAHVSARARARACF